MIKVFISYSSKDSDFVRRLANDLRKMGFDVWLDKWKIKVGDDIFDKIQFEIRDSDFVILALSRNSISSGWVDKEWKMVYWNEISSSQVKLLPILLEDCEIPEFLKFRKYADFRKGYEDAFNDLTIPMKSFDSKPIRKEAGRKTITGISKLQLFEEVFRFAWSSDGLDLPTKASAREFALQWLEKHE